MPVAWSDENSSYYIAPVGVRTHDLPHTAASNMDKVFEAAVRVRDPDLTLT